MKLAVYAICKNEEKQVDAWLDAILPELKEDDSIIVVDTGSTDETVAKFKARGVEPYSVHISPWRFDTARNTALSLCPADCDYAWSLDLDERPSKGWRGILESQTIGPSRFRYHFVWNRNKDGSEGITFYADKLHSRNGFTWKGIAHEWLSYEGSESQVWVEGLGVEHYQDHSINRLDRDLRLMERAIKEHPDNERLQHYYARQLLWCGQNVRAAEWFLKHLDNPKSTWRHERSESMLYLSKCGGNDAWIDMWIYRAVAECPERREVWFALADRLRVKGEVEMADYYDAKARSMKKDKFYLSK